MRDKKREIFNLNWPLGCFSTSRHLFKRNKKSNSIDQEYQLEGTVVVAKKPMSSSESAVVDEENHAAMHEMTVEPNCCAEHSVEIKKNDIGVVELMKL